MLYMNKNVYMNIEYIFYIQSIFKHIYVCIYILYSVCIQAYITYTCVYIYIQVQISVSFSGVTVETFSDDDRKDFVTSLSNAAGMSF
jgi:hypothetical protein